jgi:predicted nucleotidyltransferase
MDGAEDEPIAPAALETVCTDPAVQFVVAFGSRVEGTSRASSDLDLAVKFEDDCSEAERFRKRCHYLGHLQRRELPLLDVVDLDTLPIEVAHAAVGGELVCGDADAFQHCRRDIESAFAERRDGIERRHRERIARVADEGLHG